MTEPTPAPDEQQLGSPHVVHGGGPRAADAIANDPVRAAAMKLELLSPETREQVLARMDAEVAGRIRDFLASQPTNRPHGQFSTDVATRRQLIHQMADSVAADRTSRADSIARELDPASVGARAGEYSPAALPAAQARPTDLRQPPAPPADPLDTLRELHPAAIARAMQGERAEAWAIVLDRLDVGARAALQLYLDPTARAAIDEARARQAELAESSPTLIATVVAAIGRTVVPRATREHHQLLSTTPLAWTGQPA